VLPNEPFQRSDIGGCGLFRGRRDRMARHGYCEGVCSGILEDQDEHSATELSKAFGVGVGNVQRTTPGKIFLR
jgi:hypothetical protein